jgi:hypothetical protein
MRQKRGDLWNCCKSKTISNLKSKEKIGTSAIGFNTESFDEKVPGRASRNRYSSIRMAKNGNESTTNLLMSKPLNLNPLKVKNSTENNNKRANRTCFDQLSVQWPRPLKKSTKELRVLTQRACRLTFGQLWRWCHSKCFRKTLAASTRATDWAPAKNGVTRYIKLVETIMKWTHGSEIRIALRWQFWNPIVDKYKQLARKL